MEQRERQRFARALADAVTLHKHGEPDLARSAYDDLRKAYPRESEPVRLLALLCLSTGASDDAQELGEQAVELNPSHAPAWASLARINHGARRWVRAEAAAIRALALDSSSAEALLVLGLVEGGRQRNDLAVQYLTAACRLAPADVEIQLHLGTALDRVGRHAEAQAAHASCVRAAGGPSHPLYADAHNNWGLSLLASGFPSRARMHFNAALAARERFAEALYNRGLAWKKEHCIPEAIADYRAALALRPAYPDALNNLGTALLASGDFSEAETVFRTAVALSGTLNVAYSNLFAMYVQQHRFEDASVFLAAARSRFPPPEELDYWEAMLLCAKGDGSAAEPLINAVLAGAPGHLGALELKAASLQRVGAFQEAAALLEPLADAEPGSAERWNNLGTIFIELRDHERAISCFRRALSKNSRLIGASNNLALTLARKKHLHEAEAVLREVLATSHDLETQINLAQLLEQQDRRDEALAMLESTIARNPSEPKAYCNLGVFLLGTAKIDGAEAAFKQALRLNPDMALARWNLSFCYLSRGDYARGWEFYETRYSPDMPRRLFPLPQIPDAPLWRGESLARAHILVVHEQGYGDQIQSLRFLPLLASRGGQITVSLPQPLIELASSMGSQYRFVSAIPNERFDFYVPLMSLPGRLQVELEDLPGPMPYLHADPAYVAGNGLLLDSIGSGLKVGLVWAGNPGHPNDRHRSVPIKTLEFLLPVPGVVWFALDKAVASDQVLNGQTIHALGHRCSSFADTAALVEAMDLIISVDTAVAHLAGALGKECWLLLPFAPDWRWLLERDDSPWYPSLRLFRQQQHARWEPVFERVRSELVQLVRSRQARDAGELHPEAA